MNDVTKKLNKLVKQRKRSIVVTEQGSIKQYSRNRSSSSSSDYYSTDSEDT